jgi:hypothetical protein
MAAGVLIYQAYDTAASLHDRELGLRAEDLARAVSRNDAGLPQLKLPAKLASGYAGSGDDIFAVRDAAGRILAASPPEFGDQVVKWPLAKDDPSYFHLTNLGSTDYYGLSVELQSAAGPVSVPVARTAGANDLVSSLLSSSCSTSRGEPPLHARNPGDRDSRRQGRPQAGAGRFKTGGGDRPTFDLNPLARRKAARRDQTAGRCCQRRS